MGYFLRYALFRLAPKRCFGGAASSPEPRSDSALPLAYGSVAVVASPESESGNGRRKQLTIALSQSVGTAENPVVALRTTQKFLRLQCARSYAGHMGAHGEGPVLELSATYGELHGLTLCVSLDWAVGRVRPGLEVGLQRLRFASRNLAVQALLHRARDCKAVCRAPFVGYLEGSLSCWQRRGGQGQAIFGYRDLDGFGIRQFGASGSIVGGLPAPCRQNQHRGQHNAYDTESAPYAILTFPQHNLLVGFDG